VNYAESGDEGEDEEDAFEPVRTNKSRGRALKRRRTAPSDDDGDDFRKHENVLTAEDGMIYVSGRNGLI